MRNHLAYLIKQHNRAALEVIAEVECAERCYTHKKVLIENLAAENIFNRGQKHVPAEYQIRYDKGRGENYAAYAVCPHNQPGSGENDAEHKPYDHNFRVVVLLVLVAAAAATGVRMLVVMLVLIVVMMPAAAVVVVVVLVLAMLAVMMLVLGKLVRFMHFFHVNLPP